MKKFTFSIYPDFVLNENAETVLNYLKLGKSSGACGVFTSIHQPEFTLLEQLQGLAKLGQQVNQLDLELIVDIGGSHFQKILTDPSLKELMIQAKITGLRLDYGYLLPEVKAFVQHFELHKLVINASTMTAAMLREFLQYQQLNFPAVQVSAGHNFYPRPETGLSLTYAQQQYLLFNQYHIEVDGCVSSFANRRGPLKQGLPTLESHRVVSIEQAMVELVEERVADNFLFGEQQLSLNEFQAISQVLADKTLVLHYTPLISNIDLLVKIEAEPHNFRIDSNDDFFRSVTSRTMAQFGETQKPINTITRPAYCITIDNDNYGRYRGEIQVVIKETSADARVNVIGIIMPNDRWKLKYFRQGYQYQFKSVTSNDV